MRLTLVRVDESTLWVLWTYHHLLLDGWSVPIVFKEVLEEYGAQERGRGADLPMRRPFAEYVAWLREQDLGEAERFWRGQLAGWRQPTPLGAKPAAPGGPGAVQPAQLACEVETELAAALREYVRRQQITLSTLVQGVWALMLAHLAKADEVLFGVVVAGRSAPLAGIETMVGMFINTLPLRIRLYPETQVADWLREILATFAEMNRFEHTSLVEIQGWSEVPRGVTLFDSILVFENFPRDTALRERPQRVEVRDIENVIWENYPLVVEALPRHGLRVQLRYSPQCFDRAVVERIANGFVVVLKEIAERGDISVAELRLRLAEADREHRARAARELAAADRSILQKSRRTAVRVPEP